jgi:hypothetical protein
VWHITFHPGILAIKVSFLIAVNIVALALANLIGGLFVIGHNVSLFYLPKNFIAVHKCINPDKILIFFFCLYFIMINMFCLASPTIYDVIRP